MRRSLVTAAWLVAFVTGCAGMTVHTDFDRDTHFEHYKSFAWMRGPDPHAPTTLMDKRVHGAVETELAAKGYEKKIPANADFLIVYHAGVREKVNITTTEHPRWRRPPIQEVDVHTYKEGTLVLDFVGRSENQLIWRGWATGAVGNPDDAEEQIEKAVTKMLAKFPPR